MEILAAENNHKDFTGLAITARHRDLVMLDYFAISPCHRQGGVGSKVFRMLKERYAGQRFFLEIESTLVKAENAEQRKRRKAFYLKNGMVDMPFTVDAFGVEMEILADGCSLEFEEYRDLYHSLFGASAHGRIKLKTPLPQASKNNRRHMNLQKPRSTDGVLFHFPPRKHQFPAGSSSSTRDTTRQLW